MVQSSSRPPWPRASMSLPNHRWPDFRGVKVQIRTIYRWVLALPLVVPWLLLPLGLLHIAPPVLEKFIRLAGLAAVVGGLPYALLALGLLWWMRRKSEPQIRKAMFVAPLLMAGS